jgi:hypothetical protein
VVVAAVLAAAVPDAADTPHPNGIVARVHDHAGQSPRLPIRVVDSKDFPPGVWQRVRNLVAFRIHRPQADGTTQADAVVYLVRTSGLYAKADAALRNRTTNHEYVWCLLAAVVAHETAHTGPLTEVQALTAEIAQLRHCLLAGHLHSGDGWSAVSYLGKVEAKLRHPREHY